MTGGFFRGNRTGSQADQPLAQQIRAGAEWRELCGRLLTPFLKWIDTQPQPNVSELDRPVTSVLCRSLPLHSDSAVGWCWHLLLDSPALRHRMRVYLVDRLSGIGVCRDLSDLPPVTFHSILCCLRASRISGGEDSAPLLAIARHAEKTAPMLKPSGSDAFLLGALLQPAECEVLLGQEQWSCHSNLLELTQWLQALNSGNSRKMPVSEITRSWLELAAFRGVRRSWSRVHGSMSGSRGNVALPELLKPTMTHLGEPYGSMLVEWALAAIRRWPDRNQLAAYQPEALRERAGPLLDEVQHYLRSVENGGRLIRWLRSSAEPLLLPEANDWRSTYHLRTTPSTP
jgi:hypothetical protein